MSTNPTDLSSNAADNSEYNGHLVYLHTSLLHGSSFGVRGKALNSSNIISYFVDI